MKKLTELDLQNALDECEVMRFQTHGAWLAGMTKRLNDALGHSGFKLHSKKPKKLVITTGNAAEPECKS